MKYLLALILLLPSAAVAQPSSPPGDPSRGCGYWYPRDLQRAGVTGTTLISFHILVSGLVNNLSVVESSGNAVLDKAALRCASYWKYKPATLHGEPIEVVQKARIVWQLDDNTFVPPTPEVATPAAPAH